VYWQRVAGAWHVRRYDAVVPLPPHQPVIHVSADEADAYCRWAGRRLPTEAEWELAASTPDKRRYPWGDAAPASHHANLDGRAGGPVDVAAHPDGDSAYGCRQMFGNVWEWTSTRFAAYPGFVVDPYKEYSAPWFASPHRVLRGGCWATRARLLRNTWRNFYPPHRRDVLAGFRTCAA
jgi:iron(II)-dependent oxidoreductase